MLFSEGPHERGFGGCLLLFLLFLSVFFIDLPAEYLWVPSAILAVFFVLGVGHWIWQVRRSARERNVQKERRPPPDPGAFNFTIYDLFLTAVFTTLFLVVEPYCGRLVVSLVVATATAVFFFGVNGGEEKRLFEALVVFGAFLFIGMFPVIFGFEGTDLTGYKFGTTLIVSIFLSMYLTLWVRSQWAKRAGGTPAEESRKQQEERQADAAPPKNRRLTLWDTVEKDKKGCIGCLAVFFILLFFSESIQKLPYSEWIFCGLIIGWLLWWYWQKSGVFQLAANIGHKGYDRLYAHIIVKVAQEEGSLGAADELELLQILTRERPDAKWYEQTVRQYIRQAEQSKTPLTVLLGKFRFRFDNDTCVHLLHAICRTLIRHRTNKKYVRRRLKEIAARLGIPENECRDVEERYDLARSYDSSVEVLILIAVKFAVQNHVDFEAILDVVIGYVTKEWGLCKEDECRQIIHEARDYEYSLNDLVDKFYSNCLHPFYPTGRTCIAPIHILGILYKIMYGCGCHTRANMDYLLGLATRFDISPDELASIEQSYKNFRYSKTGQEEVKQEGTRQKGGESRQEQQRRESRQDRERSAFSAEERRYCDILGVEPGAGFDEIKKAYRRRVAEYHPDKLNHLGKELQEVAERKMKAINEAFAYFEKQCK